MLFSPFINDMGILSVSCPPLLMLYNNPSQDIILNYLNLEESDVDRKDINVADAFLVETFK